LVAGCPSRPSPNSSGFTPLPPVFFAWMFAFLVAYSLITHTVKAWFYRRFEAE
jgi:Mg2+-importing ATPase